MSKAKAKTTDKKVGSVAPSGQQPIASLRAVPLMGMALIAIDEEPYASFSEPELQTLTIRMLARELKTRRVVGFVGAGTSAASARRPTWRDFVRRMVDIVERQSKHGALAPDRIRRVLEYANAVPMSSDRLPLILQACEEWFALTPAGHRAYRAAIAEALRPPNQTGNPSHEVLQALIALGVHRFVTTNLDDEIEGALRAHAQCVDDDESLGHLLRAFTVGGRDTAGLVQLAVNASGYHYGVFHCHGRLSKESPIILTTRDYQRFYLGHRHDQTNDRKAMDLFLDANSILFVGYSLSEPDVLRPLREFVAERRPGAPERPLFALLPRPHDPSELLLRRQQLYLDYGVKVIWYPMHGERLPNHSPQRSLPDSELTHQLAAALVELRDTTQQWWTEWRRKPPIRLAQFGCFFDNRWMIRHKEAGHPPEQSADFHCAFDARTENFKKNLMADNVPLVALGGPGQGKGSLCAHLADVWLQEHPSGRALLATNHFANDFLSVIEAAALHLGDGTDSQSPPLHRLRKALENPERLLVLGNFERLLTPRHALDVQPQSRNGLRASDRWGDPMTPEVREFLDIVANAQGKVVLTSTLWPSVLTPRSGVITHLDEINIDNATQAFIAEGCEAKLALELCQVLGGHAYALAALLAAKRKSQNGQPSNDEQWIPWLRGVSSELSVFDPVRRPARAIAMTIERACQRSLKRASGKLDVLHCVALTTTPIEKHVIATALATPTDKLEEVLENVDAILKELCELRLLIRVDPPTTTPTTDETSPSARYTAHTLVRTCVLHAAGSYSLGTAEPQRFVLPCYADEGEESQQTTPAAHRKVSQFVDRVLTRLEDMAREPPKHRPGLQRQVARAAFGMIRSRWSAVGMSQLAHIELESARGHYEEYQRRLFRLADAIRREAPEEELWDRFDVHRAPPVSAHGVLYADELAWLYNELGLVSYIRGFAGNAMSLWLQGMEVNLAADAGTQGRRWRQSMLNLAIVQIETGHLTDAASRLERVLQAARGDSDGPTAARAEGFLGWICHLRGDTARAHRYYDHAITELDGTNVQRGKSLFLRYRGDLLRREQRLDEAQKDLRQSRATAEQGRHLDLVQWTHLSEAVLALYRGDANAAIGVEQVLTFAVRMSIPKLEAAALQVRAEAALANGDLGHAEHMTRKAVAIAARLGLQLRVVLGIFVLGRIARKQNDLDNARRLFSTVATLGRAHGYQLRVEQAERELQELASGQETASPPSRNVQRAPI